MGSHPITALIGSAGVVALSACIPATPLTAASPQSQWTSAASSSSTPATPPTTTLTIGTQAGLYGDPATAAKYWQQQSLEDNCGLVSVADVVGEITGHAPTEPQVIALAVSTPSGTNPGPIYAPVNDPSHANGAGGIEMADEVVLLKRYGIKSAMIDATTHPEETGLPALKRYLTDNRKIIAWVNSAIIWNTSDQRSAADHFLVVTGIDTNTEVVHLNDPGADHADEQVAISTFTTAWNTGGDSIVVTAAP